MVSYPPMPRTRPKRENETPRRRGAKKPHKQAWQDSIKYLSVEEVQTLLNAATDYRDHLVLNLLYRTGMRVGELTQVRVEDLKLSERFIEIPASHTKTKRARTVTITPELAQELAAFLKQEKRKKGYLFPSRDGLGAMTTMNVRKIVYRYADATKIQKVYGTDKNGHPLLRVHPHTLRHSHIVHSLMRGVPLHAIQQQVGHASSLTTDIYAKLAPEEVREAYERAGAPASER